LVSEPTELFLLAAPSMLPTSSSMGAGRPSLKGPLS
jgi:hypothetical protein